MAKLEAQCHHMDLKKYLWKSQKLKITMWNLSFLICILLLTYKSKQSQIKSYLIYFD